MGLANPAVGPELLSGCISKRALVRLQRRVNPDALFWMTGDKSLFYPRCDELHLPVPRTYATFERGGSQRRWERIFLEELPPQFVIKPARSGFGHGVLVLTRCEDRFRNGSSRLYTAADLWVYMQEHTRHDDFVIQERLANHPDILQLTGTPYLQTARVTTFVDDGGHAGVHYVNFKIIGGDNVIDNFHHGKTGNIAANVCPETGVLGEAMTIAPDGVGFVSVPRHPKTGEPIRGFRLPYWKEAVELACRAAVLFQPVRTIGWDIALTPSGPVLVEGNHLWDPFQLIVVGPQAPGVQRHGMSTLLEMLRASAY